MGVIDKLGGPTPDGAGWVGLHGIALGGIGVTVTTLPGQVTLRQTRSAAHWVAVLIGVVFAGVGVWFLGMLAGLWPAAAVFAVLGLLPLLGLQFLHEMIFSSGMVQVRRSKLLRGKVEQLLMWDGRTIIRTLDRARTQPLHQLLIRADEGWLVAATSEVGRGPLEELCETLRRLSFEAASAELNAANERRPGERQAVRFLPLVQVLALEATLIGVFLLHAGR